MDVQEALRQAEAHHKNAQELVGRPVGKEELLYMWDNQITALDNFLAETEALADAKLKGLRDGIRDAKKRLTDAVMSFEAQAAGEELGGDEPSPDEWTEIFLEQAGDMLTLVKEALAEKVKTVQDLAKWEEPLAVVNGYLADSEPLQAASRDLQKARSKVRLARKDLKAAIDAVVKDWKKKSLAEDDDEDDGDI